MLATADVQYKQAKIDPLYNNILMEIQGIFGIVLI